ncbi:GNAT family N-acetyltransferase [Granulosicoccus antarcticus]|uniref:Spermine/spermidine acetyltransferase n=1 Tax=Granulosicoccus antarcticus IMCC3135 TaxID=1192854 RepID=A0A2Z2NPI5_9GAMM|nr:GNAT family N-acetyltransferase [Granulosicoccus antarcticus]ASJ73179.1 Spermine/spermidine acetyltransferase [Granulosicoccus antarcticus IMCC3135]
MQISVGTPEFVRYRAAQLYDVAFGSKLALAVPDEKQRIDMLAKGFVLEHSIAAITNGELVGLAGFPTPDGSLTSGIGYRSLLSDFGFLGGNRAALVFSVYDRESRKGELLMDGIVVDASCRGQGIGTQLFSSLIKLAIERGYSTIRLDVIDTNPAARRLYERLGFVATKTERFEFLRWLLGFGASTTMIYSLQSSDP